MSRFETSEFVRENSTMHSTLLMKACEKLNWSYKIVNEEVLVYDFGNGIDFNGEYAIKVSNGIVSYNTYYFGQSADKVEQLKNEFDNLNVSYTYSLVLNAFQEKGFTFKKNRAFSPTNIDKISFFMVGRSKINTEKEPVGEIKFTIKNDGTVVSDSNYLPDDVNTRAHSAMDAIDLHFGRKRVMTKKDIPHKYRKYVSHSKNIQKVK
jgi:hypothetical protein